MIILSTYIALAFGAIDLKPSRGGRPWSNLGREGCDLEAGRDLKAGRDLEAVLDFEGDHEP